MRFSPFHQSPPPLLVPLGCAALLLSCSGDSTVEPAVQAPQAAQQSAAPKSGGNVKLDDGVLTIEDMLSDPLFRTSVEGVVEPAVQEPLLGAVDALEAGRTSQATVRIVKARAEADALLDDPDADFESLIWWAVLERYFEEAELI